MLRGRTGVPALVPPVEPVGRTPLIDVGDAVPLVRHALRSRTNARATNSMFAIVTCTKTSATLKNPLIHTFLPSLNRSITKHELQGWDVRLYICVDNDDDLLQNGTQFLRAQLSTLVPVISHIEILSYPPSNTIPHGLAAARAFSDGADYVHRTNDDTRFLTRGWINASTSALKSWNNIGVVGPISHGDPKMRKLRGSKSPLLTRDVVHRSHMTIFAEYYPKCLRNWYMDDWISHSYALHGRASFVKEWHVNHEFVRRRYKAAVSQIGLLNTLVSCGVDAINASKHNRLSAPISCC